MYLPSRCLHIYIQWMKHISQVNFQCYSCYYICFVLFIWNNGIGIIKGKNLNLEYFWWMCFNLKCLIIDIVCSSTKAESKRKSKITIIFKRIFRALFRRDYASDYTYIYYSQHHLESVGLVFIQYQLLFIRHCIRIFFYWMLGITLLPTSLILYFTSHSIKQIQIQFATHLKPLLRRKQHRLDWNLIRLRFLKLDLSIEYHRQFPKP